MPASHRTISVLLPCLSFILACCQSNPQASSPPPETSAARDSPLIAGQLPAPAELLSADTEDREMKVAPSAAPVPSPAPVSYPVAPTEQDRRITRKRRSPTSLALSGSRTMGLVSKSAQGVSPHDSGYMAHARPSILASPPKGAPKAEREQYAATIETPFARVSEQPLSTFSIDVDTASYSNVRRFLNQHQRPPRGAVRVEEFINYFPFDYPDPPSDKPFSVTVEVSDAPWNKQHRLLHIGVQGRRMNNAELPPRNLVFLLDVSGSMSTPNKLPLLKRALGTLTETLREKDQVAIAVYAGASGLVLPPTRGDQQARILEALDRLQAGGGTNGAAGIQLAYTTAESMARPGSNTRVILATDGDFNVGMSSDSALYELIKNKRESGVFLSVLGFGMGNYQDTTLEMLADKGNGNYAYLDTISEARKVLIQEGGATLTTLAKDVKLQVEFNPALVSAYRLIGYENRRLAARDFNDDKKDAGELGAGHSVTALYELIVAGEKLNGPGVDALKYQSPQRTTTRYQGELAHLKLRYKRPTEDKSRLLTHAIVDTHRKLSATSDTFRFSAAVAAFAMSLGDSPSRGTANLALAKQLGQGALGADPHGYRQEFMQLIDRASSLGEQTHAHQSFGK